MNRIQGDKWASVDRLIVGSVWEGSNNKMGKSARLEGPRRAEICDNQRNLTDPPPPPS